MESDLRLSEAYKKHQVFKELDEMKDLYDCLSDRAMYFLPSGTKSFSNYETYVFMSMQGTLDSIKEILKIGRINDAFVLARKFYDVNEYDYICPVCKHSFCISNVGDVYPCEGWQGLKIGNVKEQALKDIWENGYMTSKLRNLTYKDFPQCNSCNYKSFCSVCLIMNANESSIGDYKRTNTFMCEIARIKAKVWKNINTNTFSVK